jgi:hypothetical protein
MKTLSQEKLHSRPRWAAGLTVCEWHSNMPRAGAVAALGGIFSGVLLQAAQA